MFWADPITKQNAGIASFLNGLPNGAAILDAKLPLLTLASVKFGHGGTTTWISWW